MSNIPKRIFYVWGANEKKRRDVELCILTWHQNLPDYEIIEINEDSKEYFNFQEELKNNKWFRTVYENKLYAFIADYIRVKVLYDNGGIYFDTDVSVLKSLDMFLDNPAFVGIQIDSKTEPNVLEPAILGAQKGNPILKDIISIYKKNIWEQQIYTMPQVFQKALEDRYGKLYIPPKKEQTIINFQDITLYPESYFIPFRHGQQFSMDCIEENTHTIHWFGASWTSENIKYFLRNKHKEDLKTLTKKCFGTKTFLNNSFISFSRKQGKYHICLDFAYIFKFKYRYYDNKRYLTLFIFGYQIKLWRM